VPDENYFARIMSVLIHVNKPWRHYAIGQLFHSNDEKTIQRFSKYIHKCFKSRQNELSKTDK